MSQLVATRVIHVPTREMLWPPKKRRKLRCCRARVSRRPAGVDIHLQLYGAYLGRPLKPSASIGILKIDLALLRTPGAVTISFPSAPSAPAPVTNSVFLSG